ncbi:aminotransferase class I/II-fold pyridoxal phosphate-dependent enzyme [Clostridium sp.]|uniref:aminotransferase class I/II-fold pyridoxal phosphate-dependent enzyme n=1 Tax=Clostridium sp. TaxID=1506 RepID=UPI002A8128C0|nr:aminotransferase class I/II-fold pyridoxal phosphate-dependent enzyme [Clostridium sp.]MDY4253740.1 aminotransferase class I/II-fold pyridoxal phosphate-dependent enzyme [Clostridium sp.]
MNKAPLLEELLKYHKEDNLILSMPGNKSGKGFLRDTLGITFKEALGTLDITEVDSLDNLHCPEGVIKEAQELLAKTYGVKKAYFLVNGSSCGNLASIFSAFNEGDEVLVERNCHKSIYNTIILKKLKVVYIDAVIDNNLGIFLPPREEEIFKAFEKANNPKGIILTNPNYFGISYKLDETIQRLREKGLKIIIDSAHGAHFGICKELPKSMAKLGDYVVLSSHKTLPSLTQGAFLLVNSDDDNIDFYIKAFMTTSPSYLIMASLDYARYYLDNYGEEDYYSLIERVEFWKEKINSLGKVKIISHIKIDKNYIMDKSRYLVTLKEGYSGHKLLDYLKEKNIQSEMSFSKGVVLILATCNSDNDFEKLYYAIKELNMKHISSVEKNYIYKNIVPEKVLEPFEVLNLKYKKVFLNEALGKISKNFIVPYPPGIPTVCPGEIITLEVKELIDEYLRNNLTVIGVKDKNIEIIDI